MVKIESTTQIIDALRSRYEAPTYAFLTNVSNATGSRGDRYADAIAVCLWESRGLTITGFEVKASRADWLRELKDPGKADPIACYCDEWYLVLGDESILQFGELPVGWGLMVPHTSKSLKLVTESKKSLPPKPVDKYFMAAMMRRVTEQLLPGAQKMMEYQKGVHDGEESEKRHKSNELTWANEQLKRLGERIKSFESASGVDINNSWQKPEKIGQAVKAVLDGSYMKELDSLKSLRCHAQNCLESIDEEIKKLEKPEDKS